MLPLGFTHGGLEAVRLLTNHDLDTGAPFATILLGQPDLAVKMRLGVLAALDQRISVRHHMTGMTANETAGYIRHHLTLAGRSDPLFSDDTINLVHTNSRGKPRAVNNLALAALLAARANDKPIVDEASARTAITETTEHPASI
jgi:type II secretory pathway predicted ATPase ExeA